MKATRITFTDPRAIEWSLHPPGPGGCTIFATVHDPKKNETVGRFWDSGGPLESHSIRSFGACHRALVRELGYEPIDPEPGNVPDDDRPTAPPPDSNLRPIHGIAMIREIDQRYESIGLALKRLFPAGAPVDHLGPDPRVSTHSLLKGLKREALVIAMLAGLLIDEPVDGNEAIDTLRSGAREQW